MKRRVLMAASAPDSQLPPIGDLEKISFAVNTGTISSAPYAEMSEAK